MKKKIGEIYNKPIVTGDKNLVTKNEIHESTLKGGTVDSGSSDVEYFKIDYNYTFEGYTIPKEGLHRMVKDMIPFIALVNFKYKNEQNIDHLIVASYKFTELSDLGYDIEASVKIMFAPVLFDTMKINTFYDYFNSLDPTNIDVYKQIFTPITKEEFYDLNNI